MAGPGRMLPEERKQAHALLARALSDPNWQTASQALDDLMRKLLVTHRLQEPGAPRQEAIGRADVMAAALTRQGG